MEAVIHKGKIYSIVGVWHYVGKCVVLLDMGLCFLVGKADTLRGWDTKKVVGPMEVKVIGKEIANVWHEYQLGNIKETHHKVKQGMGKETGYANGVFQGLVELIGK